MVHVIVSTNMFGEILSDEAPEIAGGRSVDTATVRLLPTSLLAGIA